MSEVDARTLLAKFGLGADHIGRPCTTLSPGERTRAHLAELQAAGVNLLVLDEPTNHLDLEAVEQLEQALAGLRRHARGRLARPALPRGGRSDAMGPPRPACVDARETGRASATIRDRSWPSRSERPPSRAATSAARSTPSPRRASRPASSAARRSSRIASARPARRIAVARSSRSGLPRRSGTGHDGSRRGRRPRRRPRADEVVAGAAAAASETIAPVLYGPRGLDAYGLELVACPEVISMSEKPAEAVRAKPDSTLVRSVRAVGDGDAAAVVSAGNTGAVLAASLLHVRRLPGVHRPGIAIVIPSRRGPTVLIDAGANADARPEHLVQFAHMGVVFAEEVLDIREPAVRLLSIGEEPEKGNQLTLEAHALLADADLRFEGNTEGRSLLEGEADVIVCDGFTGNVAPEDARGDDPERARRAPRRGLRVGPGTHRRPPHPTRRARAPLAARPRHLRRRLPARPPRPRR